MGDFVELDKVRASILDSIGTLLALRTAAEAYAATPTDQRGEQLVEAFNKFSSQHDGMRLHLTAIVKQANGIPEDDGGKIIVATETENGVLLK